MNKENKRRYTFLIAGISYDAYVSREIYNAMGRRSRKKEAVFMEQLREYADVMAAELSGTIFWDKPLRDAHLG